MRICTARPKDFVKTFTRVVCCVRCAKEVLVVFDRQSGDWVLPFGDIRGGKITEARLYAAMLNAIKLSTGWLTDPGALKFMGRVFCQPRFEPEFDCVLYFIDTRDKREIMPETIHLWASPPDASRALSLNYPGRGYFTRKFMELAITNAGPRPS